MTGWVYGLVEDRTSEKPREWKLGVYEIFRMGPGLKDFKKSYLSNPSLPNWFPRKLGQLMWSYAPGIYTALARVIWNFYWKPPPTRTRDGKRLSAFFCGPVCFKELGKSENFDSYKEMLRDLEGQRKGGVRFYLYPEGMVKEIRK